MLVPQSVTGAMCLEDDTRSGSCNRSESAVPVQHLCLFLVVLNIFVNAPIFKFVFC